MSPRIRDRMWALYADPVVRILGLLVTAFLLAMASIVSFLYLGPTGEPSRLELGLLTAAVVLTFYVSITSGSM